MTLTPRSTSFALAAALLLAVAIAPLALPGTLGAQERDDEPPCSSPEHRRFDFWLGEWDVYADGEKVGENTIRRAVGGCVVHESYRAAGSDYEGQSFNVYDERRGVWHQTWVDDRGLLLQLDGGFENGTMTLEGTTRDPGGSDVLQRISWHRIDGDPDRVRQLWVRSTDDGRTWEVVFDGTYRRVP